MNYDIGLALGMLLQSRCKSVITGLFGDIYKTFNLPTRNILGNCDELYNAANQVGYSTNGYKVITHLIKENIAVDKVMMFTDCQMWDSGYHSASIAKAWHTYKKNVPNAKLYLFDLNGYGNTPVSTAEKDVYLIVGWSDKVFDMLAAMDEGDKALASIKRIEV